MGPSAILNDIKRGSFKESLKKTILEDQWNWYGMFLFPFFCVSITGPLSIKRIGKEHDLVHSLQLRASLVTGTSWMWQCC